MDPPLNRWQQGAVYSTFGAVASLVEWTENLPLAASASGVFGLNVPEFDFPLLHGVLRALTYAAIALLLAWRLERPHTNNRKQTIALLVVASVAARIHVDFAVLRLETSLPHGSFLDVWGASGTVGWTALRALRQGVLLGSGALFAVANVGVVRRVVLTLVLGLAAGAVEYVFLANANRQMFSTGRLAHAQAMSVCAGFGAMASVIVTLHVSTLIIWGKSKGNEGWSGESDSR